MKAELVSERLYKELANYIMRYPRLYREELYDQLMKGINFNF